MRDDIAEAVNAVDLIDPTAAQKTLTRVYDREAILERLASQGLARPHPLRCLLQGIVRMTPGQPGEDLRH